MSTASRAPETAPALARLVRDARYEVLPTARVEAEILEHVPRGRTVTVTASPAKGLGPTLALSERLAELGYDVVPHLAARMVSGRGELAEIADRLVAAGVHTVFVPAGDATDPAGGYAGALDLLEDLAIPAARSGTSGSPAIRSPTRPSTTTSRSRRCGTSGTTPVRWSAT